VVVLVHVENLAPLEHRQVDGLARRLEQLGHAHLRRVPDRQAQGQPVAQLPDLERGRVLGRRLVLDHVAQLDEGLKQAMHVALAHLEHGRELAHAQRPLAAREGLEHLKALDQSVVHPSPSRARPAGGFTMRSAQAGLHREADYIRWSGPRILLRATLRIHPVPA